MVLSQRLQHRPCLSIYSIQLSFSFVNFTFNASFCQEPIHSLQYSKIHCGYGKTLCKSWTTLIRREKNITSFMVSWTKLWQLGRYIWVAKNPYWHFIAFINPQWPWIRTIAACTVFHRVRPGGKFIKNCTDQSARIGTKRTQTYIFIITILPALMIQPAWYWLNQQKTLHKCTDWYLSVFKGARTWSNQTNLPTQSLEKGISVQRLKGTSKNSVSGGNV